ncbi:MAG: ATP-binding protein, partial [Phyllobacteriaceae bacterium]|nr:ATP-binding protein [Phyllobacteriaceae bacterium]
GLGVPAVEKILEQHGGFLTITSEVGRGATFDIHLPLVAAPDMTVEAA